MIKVNCKNCGKGKEVYPSQVKELMFCNKSCHRSYKNNIDNPSYHRDVSGDKNPMWGKSSLKLREWNEKHKGENSPNWKGGVHRRKDGYVRINVNGERHLLHRYLLKDQLQEGNVVHHKDQNPTNNNLENLQIISNQAEHARLHKLTSTS